MRPAGVSDWVWDGRRGIIDLDLWRDCLAQHYERTWEGSGERVLRSYMDRGGRFTPNKWEQETAAADGRPPE